MDKIKELLQDQNNKIIAIAILVVLVLGIAILVGVLLNRNSGSSTASSTTPGIGPTGTAGMPSGPAGMPTGATGPAGMSGPTGMPSTGMGPAGMTGPSAGMPTGIANADDTGDSAVAVVSASYKGKPQEAGRLDPFAPIGVAKASKTKTFGNAVKARMAREGVDWKIPDLLAAISFTDYIPGETKIGYVKTAADIKREKDKADAKKAEEEKKQKDAVNAYLYAKPSNIRLSSIMTGSKGKTASFEVNFGGRSDYKSLQEGDKLLYGYYGTEKMEAELKSIGDDYAILKVVGEDVEWKYNLTDGSSRNTGYGGGMNPSMGGGMMNPGMGGGMMNPGMGGGMMNPGMGGGMMNPGMGGGMMNPGMGGGMMNPGMGDMY
ncbi:MAG: hypothetical protein IJS60_02625 [Abditibacteriota bacterium]|nr:hypothetical protein [Abditibacteriota bacterium]